MDNPHPCPCCGSLIKNGLKNHETSCKLQKQVAAIGPVVLEKQKRSDK